MEKARDNLDSIVDFTAVDDTMELSQAIFAAAGPTATVLTNSDFHIFW